MSKRPTALLGLEVVVAFQIAHFLFADEYWKFVQNWQPGVQKHANVPRISHPEMSKGKGHGDKIDVDGPAVLWVVWC